ncbi:ribose 5-phosphate isomerase B [Spiroplasma endosymbiont of Labia minor]|uniref:ribose 5-phosphate isomerase B n=1 Tax=Spiroplasma endosymbiont of Labia minor TaxID=3066305 RepID=UPI0030D62262
MRIYVANDHTAVEMKNKIIEHLNILGHEVINLGTDSIKSISYAEKGIELAKRVVNDKESFGIAICGTGIGISIAANKVNGARAALSYEETTTRLAREHNNANILALGARIIAIEKALKLIDIFLSTPFEGGRHIKRIESLDNYNG